LIAGRRLLCFQPDYIDRAVDWLGESNLGIGVVHSHPQGYGVTPSRLDDEMDQHFGTEMFLPYAPERPYASLIMNRAPDGSPTFSGRVFFEGEWMPVVDLRSSGKRLEHTPSALNPPENRPISRLTRGILARWMMVADERIVERLRNATIGIIGCSGTGSPLIEALARAQVGGFVLVDPDRISLSNVERVHGSRLSDLKMDPPPYKIQLMARMIREVNPDAEISLVAGNSLDNLAMSELLRCDLILGCTDSYHGRAHLGDLSSRYLVPCFDVGVLPTGQDGRLTDQLIDVTRLSPEDPCPFCLKRINQTALSDELMSPVQVEVVKREAAAARERGDHGDAYWRGEPPQLPSVGYLTSCAGNIVAGYALNWLLGTGEMPHGRIQLDLGKPGLGLVCEDEEPSLHCSCFRFRGYADQGDLSITRPEHFPAAERIPELGLSERLPWWKRFFHRFS
jgi:tRNA A37 threonylcarbamoyladenosine dehydratase